MKTSCFRWFVMCLMVCPKRAEDKMLHPCALSPLGYFNSPPYVRGRQCGPVCQRTLPPVHPRAYGEDYLSPRNKQPATGSPPCVRGRPHRVRQLLPTITVHPRAYGEDAAISRRRWARCGSPPCVRGRLQKTLAGRNALAVHPRAYGEDFPCVSIITASFGSPPCVRGRLAGTFPPAWAGRFTPVRTGKTLKKHGS